MGILVIQIPWSGDLKGGIEMPHVQDTQHLTVNGR